MNDRLTITPPIHNNYSTLPYHQLSWDIFENLCVRLLSAVHGTENISKYGTKGQKQSGFDILVRYPATGRYQLYQCKKVQKFDGADLRKAIEKWENDKWYAVTDRLVIFSSDELVNIGFIDEFELQKRRLAADNIEISKLGSNEIDLALKAFPDIVEEFFGPTWRDKFCLAGDTSQTGIYASLTTPKKEYSEVPHYIERKLVYSNKKVDIFSGQYREVLISLFSCIETALFNGEPTKIILKAEAASGKSKELENLAFRYTNDEKRIYPVLVRLVNFKSDLPAYVTSFFKDWNKLPPQNVLILFDGLDEIPSAYFDDFIKEFNLFLQANSRLNIVASIRTNVFTSDIGNGIDDENKLKPMYLNDLTIWEISDYLKKRLTNTQLQRFDKFRQRKWVHELIYNPFYLSSMVDLFLNDENALPKNRTQVIDKIIQYKISRDKDKYGVKIPVDELMKFADKLALYLTLTGNNAIPENKLPEFTSLPTGDVFRCGLFKVDDMGAGNIIQFEHNNFQEYLAAQKLSALSWDDMDNILFHNTGAPMLKPKMFNMANFLFTILPTESASFQLLFEKIKVIKASILLQFERDKVSVDLRLQIFKNIILSGKAEGIYYLSGDFTGMDLCDFINYSSEGFTFMLHELETADKVNHLYCLLDMIYYYQQTRVTSDGKKNLLRLIKRIVKTKGYDYAVYDRAIDILTIYRFFDESTLQRTIKKCSLIDHKMVRGAAIKYIDEGNFPNEYEYVLTSDVALSKDAERTFAGLDRLYLDYVFKHLNAGNAVKLLTHLGEAKKRQKQYSYSNLSDSEHFLDRIYTKLGVLFHTTGDSAILNAYFVFLSILKFQPHKAKQWGKPVAFFDALPNREDYFMPLFVEPREDGTEYILGYLFTKKLAEQVLSKFADDDITEDQLNSFRWSLQSTNRKMHDYFQARLLKLYGQRFAYKPYPNWDLIQAEREKRDFVLIGDREEFLKEAKNIYRLINQIKEKADDDESESLFTLEHHEKKEIRDQIKSSIVFNVIHSYEIRGGYKEFEKIFDPKGWDWFIFQQIEEYLVAKKRERIAPELLDYYGEYLLKQIVPHIDFNKAVTDGPDGQYTVNTHCVRLINYFRNNAVKLSPELTLDLLKLDFQGKYTDHRTDDQKEKALFEFVHDAVEPEAFRKAAIRNLESGFLSTHIRTTQAVICAHYGFQESAPMMLDILKDESFAGILKRDVVEALIHLTDDPFVFETLLVEWKSIKHEWQLKVLEITITIPDFKERLIYLIEHSDLNPFAGKTEIFWKHSLLRSGIILGSRKVALKQFEILNKRMAQSHYVTYSSNDFKCLISDDPNWLMKQCFKLINRFAPLIKDVRRNELSELFEEIIRKCAVIDQDTFEKAISEYEKIIGVNVEKYPDIIYLKRYERRLINSYYNHVSRYETNELAWELIGKIAG
jgi:hypothetical protein